MYIKYQDICIRNVEKEDCQQLANWWNDGAVMAHAGFPNGLNISAKEIEGKISNDSDETIRHLIIEYQNKSIGEMNYIKIDKDKYEIGIKICEANYQEKGLGRIILSMLIEYLFDKNASVICLDTNLTNKRAQHVYELLGFKKLRINIDSWKDQLGQLQSSVDYQLVKEDFKNWK